MSLSTLDPPLRVALAGAGRVGTAVATLLQRAGHELVAVWSRSAASARVAAERLGAPVLALDEATTRADLVLVGVAQGAIEAVARRLPEEAASSAIVCHFAGALGTGPLARVASAGGGACALHPVQACPDVDTAVRRLPGSAWGVTCSAGLEGRIDELVRRDLEGHPVTVAENDRMLWHAAAATTANGIAALLAAGEAMLAEIGVAMPQEVLGPLAAGAVANAREAGAAGATLTGPVPRGESAALQAHLDAMRSAAPHLAARYAAAARVVILAARAEGRIDDRRRAAMESILDDACS
jgi:predicted short-subunit dehydrogenase-like oxidoreductase (DUF2520 family)